MLSTALITVVDYKQGKAWQLLVLLLLLFFHSKHFVAYNKSYLLLSLGVIYI